MDQVDIAAIQGISNVEDAIVFLHEAIAPTERIDDALKFSTEAHVGQFRKSG